MEIISLVYLVLIVLFATYSFFKLSLRIFYCKKFWFFIPIGLAAATLVFLVPFLIIDAFDRSLTAIGISISLILFLVVMAND